MPKWRAKYFDLIAAQRADVRVHTERFVEVIVEAPTEPSAKRAVDHALPGVIKRVVYSGEFILYGITQISE